MLIHGIEGAEFCAVDVQFGDYGALSHDRDYDLAPRKGAAGYMPGKQVHVGYDEGAVLLPGSAAYASAVGDAGTRHRPLERAEHEFLADHAVESHPMKTELGVDGGGHIGHVGDFVGLAGDEGFHFLQQLRVFLFFFHIFVKIHIFLKMKRFLLLFALVALAAGCTSDKNASTAVKPISAENILPGPTGHLQRGIDQCAALWRPEDGSQDDFEAFVKQWLAPTPEARYTLFEKISRALEIFNTQENQLTIELGRPTILAEGEPGAIDYLLSGYDAGAHFSDDMFANKLAFITVLNFPCYSLAEKNEMGPNWSRLEWAYARMGDVFTTRIPASVSQDIAEAHSAAEAYIDTYNIQMGHLLTEDGKRLFPDDMSLLSHWNLRDELKSNYADVPHAREKQEMIYRVMERIVTQEIPAAVVNDPSYDWAPYSNRTWKNGKEVSLPAEGNVRYSHILNQFHAFQEQDRYCPAEPTALLRNFDGSLEMNEAEIKDLFIRFVSSEQVRQVGALIRERLGRDLRPYDIWYDGFKSRSAIPEDLLTAETRRRYPDAEAFHRDMPRMLRNLGFDESEAQFLADHIVVEGARGSGHAWECLGRTEPARLRTRIGPGGMDYKGYNIAVHEFGHNVEQVTDLYHIDYYPLFGVPNNATTEAMAFLFQVRDLQLLGYCKQQIDDNATLDIFWGMYEIMGVSLVDIYTWDWLYAHPKATVDELRDAVLRIAREVWNQYYEPVLGTHDSPLLAIYSHMLNYPMYLPNYPVGHIIHYQLEEHLAGCGSDAAFAAELQRIYRQGRLTPQCWMQGAVGAPISVEPILTAVSSILR